MNDTYNRAEIGKMPVNLAGLQGHATVVYVSAPTPGYDIVGQGRTVFLPEDRLVQTGDGILEELTREEGRPEEIAFVRLEDFRQLAPDAVEALEAALDENL